MFFLNFCCGPQFWKGRNATVLCIGVSLGMFDTECIKINTEFISSV